MTFDPHKPGLQLGIVGCGAMGRGIAQIAAKADIQVLMFDCDPKASQEARTFVVQKLERELAKNSISDQTFEQSRQHLLVVQELDSFAECDVVIEAISEQIQEKHNLFAQLENQVRRDCIIATNTSSLSISLIGSHCQYPQRVIGFHFFNPVPLMKLVEVIAGVQTAPEVVDTMLALGNRLGHTAIQVSDTPGFLVNHAGRGLNTEACRLLSEGVASIQDIDQSMTIGAGFRLGPFELMDLIGIDVTQAVMESVYHQYYQEPRFRPDVTLRRLNDAKLLGRKSGQGFYRYLDGQKQSEPEKPGLKTKKSDFPVWVSSRFPAAAHLKHIVSQAGANLETGKRPSATALCLLTPQTEDCTHAALMEGVNPERTLAIDTWLGLNNYRTLMRNPATLAEYEQQAVTLLGHDGKPCFLITDSPGFVVPRILAVIVNIACEIAQQNIARPADINKAVQLALGYPQGPLILGDEIGAARVLDLLHELYHFYGDPRYRPSPWLQRRAKLGLSLNTEEYGHD